MNKEKALEIITMIADGYNPYGDENSTQNLPELHPITIRALCVAIVSLLSNSDKSALMKNYQTQKQLELAEIVDGPLKQYLLDQEKELILSALAKSNFDIAQAADEMSLKTADLKQHIELLGLRKEIGLRVVWKIIENDYHNVLKKKGLDYYLAQLEKNAVKTALDKTNYKNKHAADILGTTFRSLRYRIDKLFNGHGPEKFILNNEIILDFFKYPDKSSLDEFMRIVEKIFFELALEEASFVKNKAADLLGITSRSFRYKIEKIGIESNGND